MLLQAKGKSGYVSYFGFSCFYSIRAVITIIYQISCERSDDLRISVFFFNQFSIYDLQGNAISSQFPVSVGEDRRGLTTLKITLKAYLQTGKCCGTELNVNGLANTI